MFTGVEIQPGDTVVGLHERGVRSNGLSLVRKIFEHVNGSNWHEVKLNGRSLAEIALEPSKIYSKAVAEMFGGFDSEPKAEVHGVAHITGGGIPSKLGRILKPSGLGAELNDLFEPPEIVKYCQEHGEIPDHEAYRTWNMGQGMLIVTAEPEQVMKVAKNNNIKSQEVGKIIQEKEIRITNKGTFADNEPVLKF
jgi:phosphoribosylformylglycinamidine cyclo-ligase